MCGDIPASSGKISDWCRFNRMFTRALQKYYHIETASHNDYQGIEKKKFYKNHYKVNNSALLSLKVQSWSVHLVKDRAG